MYFWRIHRMKADLAARELPPRSVVGYVLAYLLLMNLATLPEFFSPSTETAFTFSWPVVVFVLASVAILVVGLMAAYRANGGDDGRDLAGRLLALSWVLGLRVTMLFLPLFIALMIGFVVLEPGPVKELPAGTMSVLLGFVLMINVFFFWRLAHHLRDVNRKGNGPPAGPIDDRSV
jgi:hypothetical protein